MLSIKDLTLTNIGSVDFAFEGSDQYVLVCGKDITLTKEETFNILQPFYYTDCKQPGGYFCHNISVIEQWINKMIVIVHHRFDC